MLTTANIVDIYSVIDITPFEIHLSFCSYVHVLGVRMCSFKMSAPLEIERSHIENNMQI